MRKIITALMILLSVAFQASSQDRLLDHPVTLKTCHVEIHANSFIANTIIELEFYNPYKIEMEGTHTFTFDKSQVINGFQLELDGKFREGSIEEKRKANNTYNSIVGKRIDPAIIQKIGIDQYRLNVYPILPNSSRKVRIRLTQILPIQNGLITYALPMHFNNPADLLTIDIKATSGAVKASTEKGLLENTIFTHNQPVSVLSVSEKNVYVNKPISFSFPLHKENAMVCAGNGKSKEFYYRFVPGIEKKSTKRAEKLTVCWDVSTSANSRDKIKELSFLELYIQTYKPASVDIILFNNKIVTTMPFIPGKDAFGDVFRYIYGFKNHAGTDMSTLKINDADVVLLFSDGHNSFGNKKPAYGNAVVFSCITGFNYNRKFLETIVTPSGGSVIDLNQLNVAQAVTIGGSIENLLMKITSHKNNTALQLNMPQKLSDNMMLHGSFSGHDSLTLEYGYGNHVIRKESAIIENNNCTDHETIRQVRLLLQYDSILTKTDWISNISFGLKEKLVTYQTSFIVLERVEDYIKYEIEPPAELIEKCAEMNYVYDPSMKVKWLRLHNRENDINTMVARLNNRITWYHAQAPKIKWQNQVTRESNSGIASNTELTVKGNEVVQNSSVANPVGLGVSQNLSSVVVTASGMQRQAKQLGYSVTRITARELTQANVVNTAHGLTGKVSGLIVQNTNNGVFGDTRITLRGIRSLTGNNQPMLIFNNMPVELRMISTINPNDIADVTVLKSPAATAIYGADGVNGVILIRTKKFQGFHQHIYRKYRLSDMEDVDYMQTIRSATIHELPETYLALEAEHKNENGFYYDMAGYFFSRGLTEKAIEILSEASERNTGIHSKKAIAYTLEEWKMFDEAISVYQSILDMMPDDPQTMRELALAYYQNKQYQESVHMYHSLIMAETPRYGSDQLKQMAIQEMNAIIAIHGETLDLENIEPWLIQYMPVDLKIDVSGNSYAHNLEIREPGGSLCSSSSSTSRSGGRMEYDEGYHNNTSEYSIIQAKRGKYKISISNFYETNYWYNTPFMARVIIFRNFQKPNQTLEIKNVGIDNQVGFIEIAELKW